MDILLNNLFRSGANTLLVTVVLIIVLAFATNRIYLWREMQREREARLDERAARLEEKANTEKVMALAQRQQELFEQALATYKDTVVMLQSLVNQRQSESR